MAARGAFPCVSTQESRNTPAHPAGTTIRKGVKIMENSEMRELRPEDMEAVTGGTEQEYTKYLFKMMAKYGVTGQARVLMVMTRQEREIARLWQAHAEGDPIPDICEGTLD